VVALLGLGPHLQQRPHQLSGGERARVALGRALLSQPRLLLLDEPLASLDLARRAEVLPYLEALRGRLHLPIVYVSHQYEEVLRLGSYLVLLEQGRVLAQGSVSELSLHPGLQALVGPELTGAVLEAQVVRVDGTGSAELAVGGGRLSVTLPGSVAGERVRVQVLARDVILALQPVAGLSVRNALQGTIGSLSEAGDDVLVRVDLGGAAVLARITPAARRALALAPGMPVWVLFKAIATRGHAFRIERAGL
jgi:molybdate transport system ATP-binding protein